MIVGKLVFLRPILSSDYPHLVRWGSDSEIQALTDGALPEEEEECALWHQRFLKDRYGKVWAVADAGTGEIIGDIELSQIAWRSGQAELRVCIGEKGHWGRGFGTDAVVTLLGHAFGKLELREVYLRVYINNHRAIRSYEKCGFRRAGILKRSGGRPGWNDILLMTVNAEAFLGSRRAG